MQLEIATHPILVGQLPRPLQDVLEEALLSHRYTLRLDPDNADALFNTAQVLTAIAEETATDEDDDQSEAKALKVLREALELQSTCLGVQERKYQEFLEQERHAIEQEEAAGHQATEAVGSRGDSESGDVDEGEWFTVVEPVTQDTLLDTALAQLGTITTLCSILNTSPEQASAHLSWAEELSTSLLQKLQAFSQEQPERLQEIALARGNLLSEMLEAGYRSGKTDAETYKRERDAAFAVGELALETSVESLTANARSLLAWNSALADAVNGDAEAHATLRWNVLTASISNLKSASAIRGISQDDLATTHLLRGDASLYLCAMASPPISHPTAVHSATQNAKSAEVYYRNASRLTPDQEERDVAVLKSAVAQYLQTYSQGDAQGDISPLLDASPRGQQWAIQQLEDMVAENLVSQALLS